MGESLILVAEDEADIRDLIVISLQFGGFRVVGVSNGWEAVRRATKIRPDLILLDVRMPKMTGFEACRILKEQESTKDIPIVFLSAVGKDADVQMGLKLGAVAYLVKPFTPEELPGRIRDIMARSGRG